MSIKNYLKHQSYEKIKYQCLKSGTLWRDDNFPANDTSIDILKRSECVVWKRPHQIVHHPKFIIDGIEANDIAQGATGNCWFISAFSAVCDIPKFRNLSIPNGQSFDKKDYAGIFHFRFHQFGHIVDVCVDDRLPVDDDGELIYCHNKKQSK